MLEMVLEVGYSVVLGGSGLFGRIDHHSTLHVADHSGLANQCLLPELVEGKHSQGRGDSIDAFPLHCRPRNHLNPPEVAAASLRGRRGYFCTTGISIGAREGWNHVQHCQRNRLPPHSC
ncbi:hypothetical protein JCGZ_26627 [Jatropha curcas]|uniref:Uncharacterized protein n=1 Tax=Jatropha curcas TaxID=180498 RepID=A0A067JXL8_JATCU|nr:hypothetical protein JCGZ_26627 [Jatropha curcas]